MWRIPRKPGQVSMDNQRAILLATTPGQAADGAIRTELTDCMEKVVPTGAYGGRVGMGGGGRGSDFLHSRHA